MNAKSRQFYDARSRVARAMSHGSRLLILDVLRAEELCVNDLTDIVGVKQSTVSKHLVILKNAGLVKHRRKGAMNVYSLANKSTINRILDSLNAVVESNLKASKAAMK